MPIYFIPNQGQMDEPVAYYVQGKDKTLYFTSEGITLSLARPSEKRDRHASRDLNGREPRIPGGPAHKETEAVERWVVKLGFAGANEQVKPMGEAETGAVVSYFKGKPEDWHTGLPTYSKILYRDLWPGIDLIYYGTVNKLKYEFIVHPGADPSTIRLVYGGVEKVWVDENGRLQVMTPAGGFSDDVPMAYQEINGERVEVPLAYRLSVNGARGAGKNAAAGSAGQEFMYGFEVGDYDHSRPVVLDPLYPDLLRLHRRVLMVIMAMALPWTGRGTPM